MPASWVGVKADNYRKEKLTRVPISGILDYFNTLNLPPSQCCMLGILLALTSSVMSSGAF